LRNDNRSLKSQINLFHDKTNEILNMYENLSTQANQEQVLVKTTEVSVLERKYSISLSHRSTIDETTTMNLNKLRDSLFETCSKLNNKNKMIKILRCKSQNADSHHKNTNSISISRKDLKKGKTAVVEKVPRLFPEEFFHKCKGCTKNFGLCRWKYHCRVCGYLYCFYCSNNFDSFLPFYINEVRICDDCFRGNKNQLYMD
jgi:hypothetical protein